MGDHNALVGDNLHIARSQTGVGDPTGVITPGIVGQFYIDTTDNSLYHAIGLTPADWIQTAGGGAGGSIRSYGQFMIALFDQTIWTQSNWPPNTKKGASDFYDNPDEYWDCYWDMWEVDLGGTVYQEWTEQQFASVTEVYNFMAANATESIVTPNTPMHNIVVRCYDKVNNSLTNIDKLYGMNEFYSMLKGRRNYKYTSRHMGEVNLNWTDFGAWFTDLCNQNVGFPPGHIYAAGNEASIWYARNIKKMYGMPPDGFSCEIGTVSGRQVWNWGASDFEPGSMSTYTNSPSSGEAKIGCAYSKPTGTWTWFAPNNLADWYNNGSNPNLSIVLIYQLQDGGDPNKRALFLKPAGIDKVGLNWYDPTIYDLVSSHTRRDMTPVIRKVTALQQSAATRDLVWVERVAWRRLYDYLAARYSANSVGFQPLQTRFFLRHKTTKEVSPVSHARIAVAQRNRGVPFKYEVRS